MRSRTTEREGGGMCKLVKPLESVPILLERNKGLVKGPTPNKKKKMKTEEGKRKR